MPHFGLSLRGCILMRAKILECDRQGQRAENDHQVESRLTFNSNRHQVKLVKLNPTSDQDFIAISQYGACNYNELSLYSFDLQKQQLRQYQFQSQQGELLDKVAIDPSGVVKFEILPTREFITRFYNNARGTLELTQWRFNPQNGVFSTVRSWTENS